jgi:hypothetical protein
MVIPHLAHWGPTLLRDYAVDELLFGIIYANKSKSFPAQPVSKRNPHGHPTHLWYAALTLVSVVLPKRRRLHQSGLDKQQHVITKSSKCFFISRTRPSLASHCDGSCPFCWCWRRRCSSAHTFSCASPSPPSCASNYPANSAVFGSIGVAGGKRRCHDDYRRPEDQIAGSFSTLRCAVSQQFNPGYQRQFPVVSRRVAKC